jgi:hypothetical protein
MQVLRARILRKAMVNLGESRNLLSQVRVAARSGGQMGVRALVRNGVEHILDAWSLPRLRGPVAQHSVLRVCAVFSARNLVPLP